ncbi:hypothetical protein A1351_07430 [Methylosinus sp. R-45379]|nr:hypothetical protein A1351_07430 [Methylosinus sp. R-45379]
MASACACYGVFERRERARRFVDPAIEAEAAPGPAFRRAGFIALKCKSSLFERRGVESKSDCDSDRTAVAKRSAASSAFAAARSSGAGPHSLP